MAPLCLWAAPIALIYSDAVVSSNAAFAQRIAEPVRNAGYEARFIDAAQLLELRAADSAQCALLVLPDARALPGNAIPMVNNYIKQGGNLLALGTPLGSDPRFQINGQWWSQPRFDALLDSVKPTHLIESFDQGDLSRWTRGSDNPKNPTLQELVMDGANRALHVAITNFTGWEVFVSPVMKEPFGPGHTLTCFRAKGGPKTRRLAVEWIEQDGSRWIAVVNLTQQWKNYALAPEAFKAWQPPAGRGGAEDHFNPQKASKLSIGISHSHTSPDGPKHEYWFDDLGSAAHPLGAERIASSAAMPRLESLTHGYQFYPIHSAARVAPVEDLALAGHERFVPFTANNLSGIHPRPRGVGYDQDRPWRWQPILAAQSDNGDYLGALGLWISHRSESFKGGIWIVFTPPEQAFYESDSMRQLLAGLLGNMRRGLVLLEGGAEYFGIFDGQNVRLGARVMNRSAAAQKASVRIQVISGKTNVKVLEEFAKDFEIQPGATEKFETLWTPQALPAEGCWVQTYLIIDKVVIDCLSHDLNVWRSAPKPDFVEVRNGSFYYQNKLWKAHGINYMPSTGIGVSDNRFFETWLDRGSYDPEVIERDLRRIKAMNLNAVSIFVYYRSMKSQNLLDFYSRCRRLGIHVNQSLRPGTPMDFRWNEMRELIEYYRMPQNETLFAYDMAWEPSHFDEDYQRKNYLARWNDWLKARYGNIEAAEKYWTVSAPPLPQGAPGLANIPPSAQLFKDGPWRKLAADYRLFLDDILRQNYGEARRLVRTLDTRHPVSFRMQFSGDPTHTWAGLLPYDFYGLASAVDIWEPEAYGRIGSWEQVKPGRFTADYARLCDPSKPVLWAEMGMTVWDMNTMSAHPERLAVAAQYYRDFYRMLTDSGADGIFFWWYPGGFRLNENSDYGIIEPDGSDREITQVIRNEGMKYLKAPKPPKANVILPVNREKDARGLNGLYLSVQEAYWNAVNAGKIPGLQWEKAPGGK